jgi:endonuclease-3
MGMKKKGTKARRHEGTKAHPSLERKRRVSAPRGRESDAARRARAGRILARLSETYPDATCALQHDSALKLLVATILSAQCTDERVNMVTPDLFRRYPDAQALAAADGADLEAAIRSTGFYHNKAKSLLGMARLLCDEFGGQVPDAMEELLRLPGVARKTANCVLGTWYRKNEGIVVDTHVGRVAMRLRLAPTARNDKDAEKIERDLMELFPRDTWTWLAHALIAHGRKICMARKPKCELCPLAPDCPSAFTFGVISPGRDR